jgi:metal-sulfur cluster biosynthetic enzyme
MNIKQKISAALDEVMDPHMGVSLNEMGMINRIDIDEAGKADIGMVFPCIGCPAWTLIQDNIRSATAQIDGVSSVIVTVAWDKPWTREQMSDKAREHAQTHGYRI